MPGGIVFWRSPEAGVRILCPCLILAVLLFLMRFLFVCWVLGHGSVVTNLPVSDFTLQSSSVSLPRNVHYTTKNSQLKLMHLHHRRRFSDNPHYYKPMEVLLFPREFLGMSKYSQSGCLFHNNGVFRLLTAWEFLPLPSSSG